MGDFNTEVTQTSMKVFCDSYEFKNLIKDAACYKNPENPSCIGPILTNNPKEYRKFSNDKFRENLVSRLSTENIRVG